MDRMIDFRISYRHRDGTRGACWVHGVSFDAARARLYRTLDEMVNVVSVSTRCGAPTASGGECGRLTTTDRCRQHTQEG